MGVLERAPILVYNINILPIFMDNQTYDREKMDQRVIPEAEDKYGDAVHRTSTFFRNLFLRVPRALGLLKPENYWATTQEYKAFQSQEVRQNAVYDFNNTKQDTQRQILKLYYDQTNKSPFQQDPDGKKIKEFLEGYKKLEAHI